MVRWIIKSRDRASRKPNDWVKRLTVAGTLLCSATVNAQGEHKFMVVAANPHAVDAGYEALAQGGTAADAALAVQTVLNLVEPQSSGIGGGLFILYWMLRRRPCTPSTVERRRPHQRRLDGFSTLTARNSAGGTLLSADSRSVYPALSAPSKSRMLFGRQSWAAGFDRAIQLSENGFKVSPRLSSSISSAKHLSRFNAARDYFFNADGEPLRQVLS